MFTVKVYRERPTAVLGSGVHERPWQQKMALYECRSVEVEDTGITLRSFSGTEDEAWVPRPNAEAPEADDTDWRVTRVIVENAAGKTTEIIHG